MLGGTPTPTSMPVTLPNEQTQLTSGDFGGDPDCQAGRVANPSLPLAY